MEVLRNKIAIKKSVFIAAFLLFALISAHAQAPYSLPKLPYEYGALEPYVDSTTMRIHYNNHHRAYVTNLNAAISKYPELSRNRLEDLIGKIENLPNDIQTAVRNNGGGHYNHSLFWSLMTPAGTSILQGSLEQAIIADFGSVENFKTEFEKAAATRFGSGWAWLVVDGQGKLKIGSTPNQDNPLMDVSDLKGTPILGLDVWEHAYYLKYQSKRADYSKAFWNVVNWDKVSELYTLSKL